MWTYLRKYLLILPLALFVSFSASGQDFGEICRQLLETAFTQLGQNCADLAANSACYGYGTMSANFVDSNGVEIPSDEVTSLQVAGNQSLLQDTNNDQITRTITTSLFEPLNTEAVDASAGWGISLIYTAANIPQQLQSSGVRILVLGDTRLEDRTAFDQLFIPELLVPVTVDDAEIFTAPPNYPVVTTVIQNISGEFEADAISPDGQWVRVFYVYERQFASRTTAWLSVSSLSNLPDLSQLPILGADNGSPMQHMNLDMSLNQPLCNGDKTGGLLIQSEDAIETDISINDVPIRLSSALFAELIAPNCLQITALDGIIEIFPETENAIVLVSGFSVVVGIGCTQEGELFIGEPTLENNFVLNAYDGVSQNVPDNLMDTIPIVTILTASGSGQPINIIALRDPNEIRRITQYCQTEILPDYICIRFNS